MVTAETAVVLPSLVLVTMALLWALAVATAQLRCVDAAGLAARAAARGEAADSVAAAAAAAAPSGAHVSVSRTGDLVTVEVSATPVTAVRWLRAVAPEVRAAAVAHAESSLETAGTSEGSPP